MHLPRQLGWAWKAEGLPDQFILLHAGIPHKCAVKLCQEISDRHRHDWLRFPTYRRRPRRHRLHCCRKHCWIRALNRSTWRTDQCYGRNRWHHLCFRSLPRGCSSRRGNANFDRGTAKRAILQDANHQVRAQTASWDHWRSRGLLRVPVLQNNCTFRYAINNRTLNQFPSQRLATMLRRQEQALDQEVRRHVRRIIRLRFFIYIELRL